MIPIHNNTCPAFFLDATFDSSGSYSPCTALGGGKLKFENNFVDEIWNTALLEDLRAKSATGKKLPMCQRCWSEEDLEFTSERKYLIQDLPTNLDYTDPAYYMSGPRHINIKVSNICNLRCRTCQSRDSYLYHIEGEHYEQKYGISKSAYTLEKFKKRFSDDQLDKLYQFSNNVERIELYGGEPFLDDQIPKFLIKLIDNDRAKNIDLSLSTNATHPLTDTWKKILTSFQNVVINTSIDGIGKQFTYMRHPGKWHEVEHNIKTFYELEYTNTNITVQPVITVSALNVYNLPDVVEYFKQYGTKPFIILVQWPQYYCVNVIPDSLKTIVEKRLQDANSSDFNSVINLLYRPQQGNQNTWEQFKFWTNAKDEYRKENYLECFTEFGSLLKQKNEW